MRGCYLFNSRWRSTSNLHVVFCPAPVLHAQFGWCSFSRCRVFCNQSYESAFKSCLTFTLQAIFAMNKVLLTCNNWIWKITLQSTSQPLYNLFPPLATVGVFWRQSEVPINWDLMIWFRFVGDRNSDLGKIRARWSWMIRYYRNKPAMSAQQIAAFANRCYIVMKNCLLGKKTHSKAVQ